MSDEGEPVAIDPMRLQDLPQALAIQALAYPPFLREDGSAFASRITLAASYCLAARRGDELLGYLLAHGWQSQSPPAVGTVLRDGVPSEVLFLHDLAVAPAGRGLGLGDRLVARAFALAAQDGLQSAELIAVEGAAAYWGKLGFTAEPIPPELAAKVSGYGEQARWMTRGIRRTGQGEP